MFSRILVANRGEIARRVMRTARRLGVGTVAVHSSADADALHVHDADQAVHIGEAPVAESYLRSERIIDAALATGAEAIHPGYGFLSENAAFAEAVADAGLTFIGPPASAITAMGSKSESKALMERSAVPVVPGYHGDAQDNASLIEAAARVGFPLLIKASAGGGGKGMRIVRSAEELTDALDGARREAEAGFGDGRLLMERYLTEPRHVEVQVFFDTHGNGVHLFERDCSVQRRYQKVVEEAPAPGLPADMLDAMYTAALDAGRAVGYVGAGTVEFIVDPGGEFFFMEMNTRLQVEHPVTELITGVDLVEWQLRVASGEPLPMAQADITQAGAAVEVRLYAEDPAGGFLPATGRLDTLAFADGEGIRVDTGVREGDSIGIHYDPMIAKLIAHGSDRAEAIARLRECVRATRIDGLVTNAGFLLRTLSEPAFLAGGVSTAFLDTRGETLAADPVADTTWRAIAACAASALRRRALRATGAAQSPWNADDHWRLNQDAEESLTLIHGEETVDARLVHERDGTVAIVMGDTRLEGAFSLTGERLAVTLDGHRRHVSLIDGGSHFALLTDDGPLRFELDDSLAGSVGDHAGDGQLRAPMPGRVVSCSVSVGDQVEEGQAMMVLEAMKMEHTISASTAGTVSAVWFDAGDLVEEGAELIVVDAAD